MRQVRASGSLGSGRVTADSFPRGSWPGLLRDLALQFPWVPVGASAFGLAGRPLVTSPPGPRHFLSASGCWAPSTLEAAPMPRCLGAGRLFLSLSLPLHRVPRKRRSSAWPARVWGSTLPGSLGSESGASRTGRQPAPCVPRSSVRAFPAPSGAVCHVTALRHRCSPGLEGGCSGGVSSGSSPKGAGGSLYPFI